MTKTSQTRVLFQRTLSRFRMGVFAAFMAVAVALSVVSLADKPAQAATASTLNFQARLLNNAGSIVTDGKYNVEFKLYNQVSGGSALWTETYYDSNGATAGNDNRVTVRAGYVSVYLGSLNAFPGTINWDQDLYLTMNIGGTTQTATPTYDGEMNPRIKLTAVPYAFRAGQLAQLNQATGFTSTLKLAQPTVGNQDFIIPDQGAAGTFTLLTTAAANAAYIQNQNSLQQASSQFWISGSGRADTGFLTPAVDTAAAGTLSIGVTNATAVSIAKTGVATTINGSLTVTEDATFNGDVVISDSNTLTVGVGATTLGGTLTVNGTQFTNAGATLNIAEDLPDFGTSGPIGLATDTVDKYTSFTINQQTNGVTLSLPTPSDPTPGRIVYISNVGGEAFTMHSTVVAAGGNATFLWNGTIWRTIVDSGISAVGTLNSQLPKSLDGARVVGSALYLQTADEDAPGLVSIEAQTFAGDKTFSGNLIGNGTALFQNTSNSAAAFQVQNAALTPVFNVDTTTINLITNPSIESDTTNWSAKGGATISKSAAIVPYDANFSLRIDTTAAAGDGAKFSYNFAAGTYTLSFFANVAAGSFSAFEAGRSDDGSTDTACTLSPDSTVGNVFGNPYWKRFTCTFATGAVSGSRYIYVKQTDATARTFYIDAVQLETGATATIYRAGETAIGGSLVVNGGQPEAAASDATLKVNTIAGGSGLVVKGSGYDLNKPVLDVRSADDAQSFFTVNDVGRSTRIQGGHWFYGSAALAVETIDKDARALVVRGTSDQATDILQVLRGPDPGASKLFSIGATGAATFQNSTNSATAFQIQTAAPSASVLFTANTTDGLIQIGSSTTDANARLLVLDSYNGVDESAFTAAQNVNGSSYYNTAMNKFRCYQNGAWTDCIPTASGVTTVGTIDSQTKSGNGAVILGNTIYLQTADEDDIGLVSDDIQTFGGAKTFNGAVTLAAAGTGLSVTDSASIGGTLSVGGNVTVTGSISGNGVNAGTGLLQGTGGLTVTGTASINTSGTANTAIGNTTGTFTLQSSGLNVSSAGALTGVSGITTSGGYTQSGADANTFTGATSFTAVGTALTVTNNILAGTVNNLTLASATDGFTISGGTTSRTLTVTGASITIGDVIQPSNNGALTIRSNGANSLTLDAGGAAALNLGATNANAVSIASTGVTTTVNGALTVAEATTLNGNVSITGTSTLTVGTGATAMGGTLTVAGDTTLNGTQFTNNGSTLNTAELILDRTSNGDIGTAPLTVDVKTAFTIDQQTSSRTLSLPTPSNTTAGRIVYVSNTGDVSFTMHGVIINADSNASFIWNGSAWKPVIDSGISAVGMIDSQTKSSNGAVVVGSGLYLQTADDDDVGLVSAGAQTFGGNKTFNGTVTIAAAGTSLSVTNNASIGGNLTVTGSISGTGVNAGNGLLQGTGGLTVTGTTNINTTGTANTAIGNATGTFSLQSSGLNVSTAGALTGVSGITTSGGYAQTGTTTNTFSGVTTFSAGGTALAVTNSASIGGGLSVGGAVVAGAQFSVTSGAAGQVTAALKGAASQTADLFQLVNNSNEVLASFSNTGQLTLGRIGATGTNTAGRITFADGTNSNFGATLTPSALTDNRAFVLPDSTLATTASPATFCVFNGTTSNCPIAPGSPHYIQNGTTVQSDANFYIRSAGASSVAAVLEGANGQTADLLNLNSFNGTTSTTVARITAAGNLQVASSIDTTTATSLSIGTVNANAVSISKTGTTTTVNGALTVAEATTLNGNVSITGTSTLTVGGDTTLGGKLTVNGTQFTNAGATLNTAKAYTNFASDGEIDTAAASVDIKTTFTIDQDDVGITLSLPTPGITAAGRVVYVSNIGDAPFTMNGATVPSQGNAVFLWNGTAWKPTVEAGISAVGNLDGQPKNDNGATIFAGALYLQTADEDDPGLVSDTTQTFGGNKTFNGTVTIAGAGTGLSVTNNASIGGNLTVTGSISGNGVNAGTGLLQGTGGLTVTGTTNINTTGTANTAIGNATGTFSLASSGLNVSTLGALTGVSGITTTGGYTQTGTTTNSFSGVTSFTAAGTALTVNNNLSAGTVNNLTLASAADGFTIAGGTTSRTLTVTGASITIGNVIQPTNPGTLAVRSSGANTLTLDAGGAAAIALGTANASAVNIARAGVGTNVNGSLTVAQLLTGNAGATVSGGAISLTGNAASSFTTSSGALTLTSAAAATWSTASGDLTIQAGSGTINLGTTNNLTASGALSITSGGANAMSLDAGGAASLNLGITNANGVSISRTGVTTTVNGALTVAEATTLNGNVSITGTNTLTVGTGATTLGGTLTVNGTQFTNNGSTLNVAEGITVTSSGDIGSAASTVDVKTAFAIDAQAGLTLTLPTPSVSTAGRIVYISNVGSNSFTMYGMIVAAGANASFIWNGTAWNATATAGITNVGTFSGSSQPNGATISGSTITFGPADATNPGMVSTGTQTFDGAKTFNDAVTLAAAGTGLSVTNNASIGGTLTVGGNVTVTGTISGNGVSAGTGLLQGTGGLTVTGATNINTTGTANTAIGNATGTFSIQSSGLDVSTAGALSGVTGITTSGGYVQSGSTANTFSGSTTFSASGTALTVTNNISAGTINNLTLASAADGFTIAGGTTSRTLTVTGADITIGNTIRPTNPGVLGVQSNGANALNLDAGGAAAVNVGATNASAVNISKAGSTTTVNGALTVSQLLTGNAGTTVSGGAIALSGSVASSFTTGSGALTLTSAAAATWSTTAGNLTIQAGSGTVSLGTSTTLNANGALNVSSGGATTMIVDAGGAASLDLGTTNANAVSISRTGVATTINGTLTVQQAGTFNGNVSITGTNTLTVGTGATTLGGTLTVNGTQFTNAGATLYAAGSVIPDFAADGDIGLATATVDVKTSFRINQQTGGGGRILSLPTPSTTTAGRIVYVMNVGSAAFTMHGAIVSAGSNASFLWNGTNWKPTADAGIAAIGTIDNQLPKSANGAQIVGSSLYMQTADADDPGLVSDTTQTFGGDKTFNGTVTLASAGTGLSVTNNATIGGTLAVTGAATFSGNITQSGAGTFSTGTGNVTLNGATTISGTNTLTVGTGATTLGGTLTVAGNTTLNGTQFTNAGATVNTAMTLSSQPAGVINSGDATTSVDVKTVININQTGTAGNVLSLPAPSVNTAGRIVYVSNTGSVNFVMAGAVIVPGATIGFMWNGTAWTTTGSGTGVTRMGLVNDQGKNANGATISGNTLYLQTADQSNIGLVSTIAQTFAGTKTFTDLITGNAGLTVSGGAVSLTGNAASSLTTTAGTLTLQGFAGVTLSTPNAAGTTSDITINTGNSTTSGNSGAVAIRSGNASGGTAGNVSIDTGTSSTGTAQVTVGTTNAGAVSIGMNGFGTTVNGALTVSQLLTGNAGTTISGGAISLTGNNTSSLTTTSGALTLTSAAAATWSTTAGNLTIQAGSGTVSLGTSTALTANGALTVTSGGATTMTVDAGGAAALNLGTANANGVSISRTGMATTINGSLTVQQAATFNGSVSISGTNTLTVGTGATTLGGTLTVAGNTTLNGTQFTNNGSTVNSVMDLGNFIANGTIGAPGDTVDIKSGFRIDQDTPNIILTIPAPTDVTPGRIIYISNIGDETVVVSSLAIAAGSNGTFLWNGTAWKGATEGGASTIGTIDSQTKSDNGASIVGNLFYFQTADADDPGLVSDTTQTFGGDKTFNGTVTVAGAGTGLSVANDASIGGTLSVGGNLTVTGSISGTGVSAGTGLLQGTGGLTVTGATNINTTGTANTAIGNATGTFSLASSGLNVSTAGALTGVSGITTSGGYVQSGSTANTFTGATTFSASGTALTVTNNISAGTVNNLTLTSAADGFTIAGGSVNSRTLTVTSASITLGSVITPTAPGTLTVRSNGAAAMTVDAGGAAALNLGTANASAVSLGRNGITTTNNGALTVSQLLTGNAGTTISGGAISLTGNNTSSLTTTSGALTLTSAAAATWSTTAGNLTIQAGSGTVSLGTSTALTANGALTVTSGGATTMTVDAGGAASLNLGTTNANGVSISRTGMTAAVNGALTVAQNATFSGQVGIGATPTRPLQVSINNGNTANFPVLLEQTGTGDLGIEFKNPNVSYYAGVDATDDAFKISSSAMATAGNNLSASLFRLGTTGQTVFQNSNDSATAFTVQNALGRELFTVDASGSQVVLGKASTISGKLTFNNAVNANTVSIVSGNTSTSYNLTLPTALGGAGQCLVDTNGSGALGFTSCVTTTVTLQSAYNNGTASTPEVKLDGTRSGIDIQDADAALTASTNNFISLRGSNSSGLGDIRFSVGLNGNLYMKPATDSFTLMDVRRANDAGLLILDSSTGTGRLGIALGGTGASPTLPSFTLDVGGDIRSTTRVIAPAFDYAGAGTLAIGGTNATAVTVSKAGSLTTVAGTLTVSQASTFNGSVSISGANTLTVGTGLTQLGGNLTVAGTVSLNGTQLTNAGATVNTVLSLGDQPAGPINSNNATTSVDVKTTIAIAQSTGSLTLSLPTPSVTTAGRIVYILNTGGADFTMHGVLVKAGANAGYIWTGSAWVAIMQGGVTTVGTFSGSSQPNGATISGSTITFGPADATNPGMVSTGTQTFDGDKTFNDAVTVGGAGTGLSVTNNASIGGNLTVTGSISGNGVNAGTGLIQGTGGLTVTGAVSINTTGTANTAIGNTTGTFSLQSSGLNVATNGDISTPGGYTQSGTTANTFTGVTSITAANGLVLGTSTSATGGIVFKGSGGTGTLTVVGPTTPNAGNYTLSIPAITANQTICVSGTVCAGYQAAPASGAFLMQVPTTNSDNTVSPTANNVIALTVNATTGSSATAMLVTQSQTSDGLNVRATNTSGAQTNGLNVNRSGAGGTTSNLINVATTGGNVTNGINFSASGGATMANLISSPNFVVSYAGAVTAVGVNSGTGLIQGTGGLTVSGATNINTTGTANTAIGNATGTFSLASSALNVSTAGVLSGVTGINSNGGYTQTGTSVNTFTGTSNFAALTATTVNGLSLTSTASGFTVTGGSPTSRTLTVTGADITIGNTITPTSAGPLTVRSNGTSAMTVDTGASGLSSTVNIGTTNADVVSISRTGSSTTVNGSLSVTQAATFTGNVSQTGAVTFSTGTSNVSLNGSTTVTGGATFTVNSGATSLGGTLTVTGNTTLNGNQFTNAGSTLNSALDIGPFASNGDIGAAADTVDKKTAFMVINQSTPVSLTIPSPTVSTPGRIIYISNKGTSSFDVMGNTIPVNSTYSFMWNGTAWTYTGASAGVNAVGAFVTSGGSANGATITGTTITFQAASDSLPGMVSTGDQTFAGTKTFNALLTANAGLSALNGAVNLTANNASTFTTSSGALTITSATAATWSTTAGNLTLQAGSGTISLGGTNNLTSVSDLSITSGGTLSLMSAANKSLTVDTGTTGVSAILSIGTTNANAINIGRNNLTTNNQGHLSVVGNLTAGSIGTTLFTNNSATLNTVLAIANKPSGGSIGAAASTVDVYTAFVITQTTSDQTLTVPNPTILNATTKDAGRLIYISSGQSSTAGFNILGLYMTPGMTITLFWNGDAWTYAGTDTNAILNQTQTVQNASFRIGGTGSISTNSATAFRVQNADGAESLTIDTQTGASANVAVNGGAESSTLGTTWTAHGTATVGRTTNATDVASGTGAVSVTTSSAASGVQNNLGAVLPINTTYNVSFSVRTGTAWNVSDIAVVYYRSTSNPDATCAAGAQPTSIVTNFVKFTCQFTTSNDNTGNSTAFLAIRQTAATSPSTRTFFVDNLSIVAQNTTGAHTSSQLRVGGDTSQGLTLFTLDKSAGPPQAVGAGSTLNASLLGSMYFDTTAGRIQCYESNGWGSCGNVPDMSVNLIPEYTGAVLNGTGIGTMTANLCSDSLNINDGSSSQPTICGSNESYNYYAWTSPQTASAQTYSIYLRYQLPANFKDFADLNTIQLTGRTTSTSSGSITFSMYKPDGTLCGSSTPVIPGGGNANQWYTTSLGGDETTCTTGVNALGPNSIVLFKIDVTAQSNATVYVSNLTFLTKGK